MSIIDTMRYHVTSNTHGFCFKHWVILLLRSLTRTSAPFTHSFAASKQHHEVISRRRRRQIDRWCCFSFPTQTHFVGLWVGFCYVLKIDWPCHVRTNSHRSVSAERRKLHYAPLFFLSNSKPFGFEFVVLWEIRTFVYKKLNFHIGQAAVNSSTGRSPAVIKGVDDGLCHSSTI